MKAITVVLKSSGRIYICDHIRKAITKEENERMQREHNWHYVHPELSLYTCRILKDGKPYGATRTFREEQLIIK